MALNISNLAQLVKYSKHLIPSECLADRKSATATLHTTQDAQHLPQLHLTWQENHFVALKTEGEAKQAEAMGYKVEKASDGSTDYGHTYAQEVRVRHLWFMNFRRYGWSFTDDPTGEYGYGRGVTYANGPAISFLDTTSEEKIRDAMVHSWANALGRGLLPEFFDDVEIHSMLKWLLDDAIANQNRFATPRSPGKGWGVIKVEVTSDLPETRRQVAAE